MSSNAFTSYALLGSGRVARHFRKYFELLDLPLRTWSRKENPADLPRVVEASSHVLFALSDSAVAPLASEWLSSGKTLVHFSGALNVPGVGAAHPLMTFGNELRDLQWYRSIPFVIDRGTEFSRLLPGLPNPSWSLEPGQRALYHALCALAGNSAALLWREIGARFERDLSLPRELLLPFLKTCAENSADPSAWTGAVARGDWQTVDRHLRALEDSPSLHSAYESYLQFARESGVSVPKEFL